MDRWTDCWRRTGTDDALGNTGIIQAKWRNKLGRTFILQVLMFNALLSILASSIQLYSSYQRDRSQVLATHLSINQGFRSGFEAALWEYNFPLAEALLEGVFAREDVQFVSIAASSGQSWTRGTPVQNPHLTKVLTFRHRSTTGETLNIGTLEIGLSLQHINQRILSQLWTLLLSNFAKTIVASLIMFMLFEHHVSRHLSKISAHVAGNSWPEARAPLTLERAANTPQDDLDRIVNAINLAKSRSREDFGRLKQEINQRQRTEDMLRHKTRELQLTNSEQAQFTYAISHDLKSPANTVTMLLNELQQTEFDRLSADGQDILGDASRTISRMKQLIEDVMGYARTVEDGMHVEPVDLDVIVREVVQDLRSDIATAQAELVILELPKMNGNRSQLRMLLQNLLSNAIKFRSPDRTPRIVVQSHETDDPEVVEFSVSDNGIGIAPEFHETIFGLFKRLHAHSKFSGSGLGLTLCKRIVVNHMGHIEITSAPDKGTRFDIRLMGKIDGT